MEQVAQLTEVGFTEYEARVYLALLEEHPATGYRLSNSAGIPRSMVYEALGRLKARGAVLESREGKTRLYRPLPPEALLNRLQDDHQTLIRDLRQGLSGIFAPRKEESFWTLSGRSAVLSYARNMVRGSHRELMLVLNDPDLEALQEVLVQAHARGVKLHTLLTGTLQWAYGQTARHPPGESEAQQLTGSLVVVADQGEALISSQPREQEGTVTHNPNLVLIARQFVWMELFAQRIHSRLGSDLLDRLDLEDRMVFEGFFPASGEKD